MWYNLFHSKQGVIGNIGIAVMALALVGFAIFLLCRLAMAQSLDELTTVENGRKEVDEKSWLAM